MKYILQFRSIISSIAKNSLFQLIAKQTKKITMTSAITISYANVATTSSACSASMPVQSSSKRPLQVPRSFKGMPLSKILLLSRTSSNYYVHKMKQQQKLSSKVSKKTLTPIRKSVASKYPYVVDLFVSSDNQIMTIKSVVAPLCQQPSCARQAYSELTKINLEVHSAEKRIDDIAEEEQSVEDLAIEDDQL